MDYNAQSLAHCQRDYPGLRCVEGDFTDPDLLAGLGKFELVLLVNALHEVFSDSFSPELGEIDVPAAKRRVEQALAGAASCLEPGGWLVLFDGLEPPGDPHQILRVRFRDYQIRQEFENFEEAYRAAFAHQGLEISELRTLTMNDEKWRYRVEIDTSGFKFPDEHVLILTRQVASPYPSVRLQR